MIAEKLNDIIYGNFTMPAIPQISVPEMPSVDDITNKMKTNI